MSLKAPFDSSKRAVGGGGYGDSGGGYGGGGEHGGHGEHPQPKPGGIENDPVHQHAFVMLGSKTLFICHLTNYWIEEHRYQFILEVKLPDDVMRKYREAQRAHPEETFFLSNSEKDLLTLPHLASRTRTSFRADINRGIPHKQAYDAWPWNGLPKFAEDVEATVVRVVYWRLFSLNMEYPSTLTYILFGADDEAHMVNYQCGFEVKDTNIHRADFDHILSLRKAPDWIPQTQLRAGILVDMPAFQKIPECPPTKWIGCSKPLPDGVAQDVRYRAYGDKRRIEVGQTYYFGTRISHWKNPCPGLTTPGASEPPPKG